MASKPPILTEVFGPLWSARVVRSQPRENAGRAFMAALKGDWQMPKASTPPKPKRKAKPLPPEPEDWQEAMKRRWPDADHEAYPTWASVCRDPDIRDEILGELERGEHEPETTA